MRRRLTSLVLALLTGTPPFAAHLAAQQTATDTSRLRALYDATRAVQSEVERAHGHYVTTNGVRLHYLEWGDARGTPLVWAHGSAGSAYEFRALAAQLADSGYRVIAPDYRGHGLTELGASADFSIYDIADDLVALLDSLGIRRAIFGGSSKGGFVAGAAYHDHPDRVMGLLLHDGGSWSNQWAYDRHGIGSVQRIVERGEGPPRVVD